MGASCLVINNKKIMQHSHKVEPKHKSLGVKVSHLKALKAKARGMFVSDLTMEVFYWVLVAIAGIMTGILVTLLFV